ncbi:thiamine pyrophosphokinase [Nemania sp. FL0031]|nr:thiamine pyrophosphokinase [Nemania sp. FL0031]
MVSHSPPPPDSDFIEWHPIRQLLGCPGYEFVLITLNQPIRDHSLFRDLWSSAKTTIATDGAANEILELTKDTPPESGDEGPRPNEEFKDLDVIIGDLDSLADTARDYFSRSRLIKEPDQLSYTDFGKAITLARHESPAYDIVCMGGLGGRVDHGLSQIHYLYIFQKSPTYADGRIYLASSKSLSFVLKGGKRHRIHVREPSLETRTSFRRLSAEPFGKHVGIIPVGEPAIISTQGLEWDVQDWPTSFGGRMSTSNHVLPETEVVEVQSDKDVLFTIALKAPDTQNAPY